MPLHSKKNKGGRREKLERKWGDGEEKEELREIELESDPTREYPCPSNVQTQNWHVQVSKTMDMKYDPHSLLNLPMLA